MSASAWAWALRVGRLRATAAALASLALTALLPPTYGLDYLVAPHPLGEEAERFEAAGATLWTVYLPPSPEYGPRYLTHPLESDFHAFWAPQVAPYRVMPTLPQDHYTDYRHLNNDGRALMTELLATLLVEADEGMPGAVPAVLEPRPAAETEALEALRRDGRRGKRRRGRRKGAGF